MSRMNKRGIGSDLVELLIKEGVENKAFLQNKNKMSKLKTTLDEKNYNISDLFWNDERNIYELTVKPSFDSRQMLFSKGPANKDVKMIKIGRGLIYSTDFQKCIILGKNIFKYDKPPFTVLTNENETDSVRIKDKTNLLSFMIEEGKKGLGIQRYKGLGEMNPDQLWETTMNPETRTLLSVKLDDAGEADRLFSILMGSDVEKRRNFIRDHALEVQNLDV